MKKFTVLALMLVMLFSATLTVHAEESPKGTSNSEVSSQVTTNTSPKTGESDGVLFTLGAAIVILAAGTLVVRKKANA